MKKYRKIYFLGGGNMAEAIIKGLFQSDSQLPITVVDRNIEKRDYLKQEYPLLSVMDQLKDSLSSNDVLFIAVKPQDVSKAVTDLHLESPLVISIAAGLSKETLSRYLGGLDRVIRVMPNTPVAVLEGIYGLYADTNIQAEDKLWLESVLKVSGQCVWVQKEESLHSITAISGSGPAYVFYFMDALFKAAKDLGFDESQANLLILQTVLGGVKLAKASPLSFRELQQKVTSHRGTTYAAITAFDEHKLDEIIATGVKACAERSQEMAEELEAQ